MKSYEFYDIFKKTCSYKDKDGIGECKKTRESKKCVDGVCENVRIPESKLDILDDYYSTIKDEYKFFKCPEDKCDYKTSLFENFKKHISKYQEDKEQEGGGPQPRDKALYNYVKQLATKKFKSKSGIYRSSWIVREYKKRGGKYIGKKTSSSGLKRWYKEKWIDLNRPIRNSKGKIIGYKSCGRPKIKGSKAKYPLCRPSKKINRYTPRTYKSISSKSISKAKREKSKIKHRGNIKFGAGRDLEKKRKISLKTFIEKRQDYMKRKNNKISQLGNGKTRSQYHGRKSKVMIKVPKNVKNVALYSFKLKKMGFGGGIETGWKRAKQLATREAIPIEDLRYMRAWFARHLYASYPSYKQWKKAGRPKDPKWHKKHGIISWLIWGGDAAFNWVNSKKNINLLNKHYNKNYKPLKLK